MLTLLILFAGKRYLVGPGTRVDMYLQLSMDVANLSTLYGDKAQQIAFFDAEIGWAFDRLYFWGFHIGTYAPPLILRDTLTDRDIPINGLLVGTSVGLVPISGFFIHPLLQVRGGAGFVSDARDGIGYYDLFTYVVPAAGVEINITPYIKAGVLASYRYLIDLNPPGISRSDPMGPSWGIFFKLAGY